MSVPAIAAAESRATPLRRSLLACIALTFLLAALALARNRGIFLQPGALFYILPLFAMPAVYTILTLLLTRWHTAPSILIRRYAVRFGLIAAAIEALDILCEDLSSTLAGSSLWSLGMMLCLFATWTIAALRAAAASRTAGLPGPRWVAIATAAASAAIGMIVTVPLGMAFELFLHRPNPAAVATWAEYTRSGWIDPSSFATANTLDSGFSHLLLAPILASLLGTAAAFLVCRPPSAQPEPAAGPATS